jgi:hypothetical protein
MRRFAAILAFTLLLAGCATLGDQSKDKLRDQTLDDYAAALRWGGFANAYQFVDPKLRNANPLDAAARQRYDSVAVAQYDTDGPRAVDQNTVQQTAQISLINKASQSAYDIVDHQTWHWDPAAKHWWLESGLPDITPQH